MTNEITETNRLDEALAQLIEKSVSGIDKATEFLASEIPDVVYQLLLWHGVKSGVYFIIGLLLFGWVVYSVKLLKKLFTDMRSKKEWTQDKWGDPSGTFVLTIAAILFSDLLSLIIASALVNIEWLQIWIAPKVWLLEYSAQLVK